VLKPHLVLGFCSELQVDLAQPCATTGKASGSNIRTVIQVDGVYWGK
jgi:hypothetical protein